MEYSIKKIKAIIGLGNPGKKFEHTRHNIGFRVLDTIATQFGKSFHVSEDRAIAEIFIDGVDPHKIIFLKPLTFMNDSGRVIPFLVKKGIASTEILIVHDELEKPFGSINIKFGGSARGHNGLRSIIQILGSEFWRLRFGIGRPEKKEYVSDYVLSNFLPQEEAALEEKTMQAVAIMLKR